MIRITYKKSYNTIVVSAKSKLELGKTFIRFQEFYESCNPAFKGKIFTLGQFKQWYSNEYGADTYYIDWQGFNLPSCVLEPFKQGLFDPLTKYEKRLLKLLKYKSGDYYIVGANDKDVLKHELAHALYYTNKKYRENVISCFNANSKDIHRIKKFVIEKGYHKDVLYDELQAYIIDNSDFFVKNTPKKVLTYIQKLHKKYTKKIK